MTNHIHLLVTTDEPTLSDGLRDILGLYARRYNHFHDRTGHLFSARFRSVTVTTDEQFLTAVRYVNRNPVRAGMIEHPEHYPWSGYGLRMLPRPPVRVDEAEVLGRLHPLRDIAERQLHSLVHGEVAPARAGNHRPTVGTLAQAMGRDGAASAAVAAGYRHREVAATLGVSQSYVSKHANRRVPRPPRGDLEPVVGRATPAPVTGAIGDTPESPSPTYAGSPATVPPWARPSRVPEQPSAPPERASSPTGASSREQSGHTAESPPAPDLCPLTRGDPLGHRAPNPDPQHPARIVSMPPKRPTDDRPDQGGHAGRFAGHRPHSGDTDTRSSDRGPPAG